MLHIQRFYLPRSKQPLMVFTILWPSLNSLFKRIEYYSLTACVLLTVRLCLFTCAGDWNMTSAVLSKLSFPLLPAKFLLDWAHGWVILWCFILSVFSEGKHRTDVCLVLFVSLTQWIKAFTSKFRTASGCPGSWWLAYWQSSKAGSLCPWWNKV